MIFLKRYTVKYGISSNLYEKKILLKGNEIHSRYTSKVLKKYFLFQLLFYIWKKNKINFINTAKKKAKQKMSK